MCPEYGATIAIFPIDAMTLDYLRLTARDASRVELVEAYAKAQGLFRNPGDPDPRYSETIDLDLATIEPSLAGPKRPQDRVSLKQAKSGFQTALGSMMGSTSQEGREKRRLGACVGDVRRIGERWRRRSRSRRDVARRTGLDHGSVVIAAITSCTNTSNPSVMIGAGLVAKKAVERGLSRKPWVKTSLAPGSKVVTEYLRKAGLEHVPRSARLQPRRLRLHDVHRQQRAAARRSERRSRIAQPRRRVGAERQPQLRGTHSAAGARELSRVAAARRRLRARRAHDDRSDERAARDGPGGRAGVSARAVADRARDSGDDADAR